MRDPDLLRSNRIAVRQKKRLLYLRDAPTIYRHYLLDMMAELDNLVSGRWVDMSQHPDQAAIDRFAAIIGKAELARDWIFDNFPKDADGAWRVYSYQKNGKTVPVAITGPQRTELTTKINALLGDIG